MLTVLALFLPAAAAAQSLPAGWSVSDVGGPVIAGYATYSGGRFTVSGAGSGIAGTSDQFTLAYRKLVGDGYIMARVEGLQNTNANSKAGVMFRYNLSGASRNAFALVTPSRVVYQRRTSDGNSTVGTQSTGVAPIWLKLTRRGAVVTASSSPNGITWTDIASALVSMNGTPIYVGFAVTSSNVAAPTVATFTNVQVVSLAESGLPLPTGWSATDIGGPPLRGASAYDPASGSRGTFGMIGGGNGITGTWDQFHYAYRQIDGDIDIVARVNALGDTNASSRAGVMIRESLTANASHAAMTLSWGNGTAFLRRPVPGGTTVSSPPNTLRVPLYVKLSVRSGVVTAYHSMNGSTWTAMGTETLTLPSPYYVGLAVSSHDMNATVTANLDNVQITAAAQNQPPSVALTAPANGATFTAPASFTISANASDTDGTISRVEFYHGSTLIASDTTSPYTINWSNVPAGTYSLTARAADDDGGTTTSAARSITVNGPSNQPPSVALTAPANGATFTAPASITVSATAGDTDGTVTRVDFFQGSTQIGTDTTSPYGITWSNVAAGTYSLTARATDNAGATTTSAARTVTVTGALPSGWAAGDIGSPAMAGSTQYASGTFSMTGGGTDIWGTSDQFHFAYQQFTGDVDIVTRVASLGQTDAWSKAGVMIRASLAANAAHVSMFATGGSGTSFQRRPTAGGTSLMTFGSPRQAPVWVRLSLRGTTITASESPDGATWTEVGTQTLSLPSPFYVGLAVVSHDAGATVDASFDNVVVQAPAANQPPSVALTAPADGATFTAPANIAISANASDTDGTVSRVDFFHGSTLIGTDTTSPYSVTWSNAPAGTYSLTARATDDDGATTTSAARSITVNGPANQPPSAALTAPADGATYTAPANVTISASASDTDGTITRVDFYQGSTLIASDTTSPYSITWSNVPAGGYTLTARAVDDDGATTTSAARSITVNPAPTQRNAVFNPSPDHDSLVTSYGFEVFAPGADTRTATPIATQNLEKPTPVNGEITADVTSTINALAAGNYQATVSAVGSGGSSRSTAVTFTR